jgi:hypothetical protein
VNCSRKQDASNPDGFFFGITIGITALICIETIGEGVTNRGCVWSQFAADTPRPN